MLACGGVIPGASSLPRSMALATRPRPVARAHLAVVAHAHAPARRLHPGVVSIPPKTTTTSPQLPVPCLMVMPPRPQLSKPSRADAGGETRDADMIGAVSRDRHRHRHREKPLRPLQADELDDGDGGNETEIESNEMDKQPLQAMFVGTELPRRRLAVPTTFRFRVP